ncbi:MAG: sigma factor-like helix-turn-helix DNA-binding protein [Christensenellales bacterium]
MKQTSWSNAVLVAYSAIPQIIKTIDFGVQTRIESGFGSKHLRIGISTEELLTDIANLNDSKRKLCNLIYIIDSTLSSLKEIDSQILILRYFKKLTFQEIATEMNVCIRTVFRRHVKAVENFCKTLESSGYGEIWLENEYKTIPMIRAIKKRMEDSDYLNFSSI